MSLEEDIMNLMKYELKSAELMRSIITENSQEDIETNVATVVDKLIGNIEDKRREQTVYVICLRMGESLNSPEMVKFARQRLEKFADSKGE